MNVWAALSIIIGLLIAAIFADDYLAKSQMIVCLQHNPLEACNEYLSE